MRDVVIFLKLLKRKKANTLVSGFTQFNLSIDALLDVLVVAIVMPGITFILYLVCRTFFTPAF